MKNFLEILQEINVLMVLIDKTIMLYRKQNHHKGLLMTSEISKKLSNLLPNLFNNKEFLNKEYLVIDNDYLVQMLNNLLQAQTNNDYVLLGDIYEEELIPFLKSIQSVIRGKYANMEVEYWNENISILADTNKELAKLISKDKYSEGGDYIVEGTGVGTNTLKVLTNKNSFYLHSNNNPYKEADIFVEEHIEKNKTEYLVYGFGFGYHIASLLENNININIIVYESDLHILTLACKYCSLKEILKSKRLKLVYDPDFDKIRKSLKKKDIAFIIHYPSVMNIKNKDIRGRFEEYFLSYSSSKNQEDLLYRNFKRNIAKSSLYIEELKTELKNKKLVIVAGGPSLDNNIEYLRELPENYKILAVGRVIKRLLDEGIKVDYFIMVDGNQLLLEQIKGLNLDHIPLLYLSTVYYEVLEEHKGKQYLILQEGYRLAEEYAHAYNYDLYKTGGSVSTAAIEVGIRLGCDSIICVGLDLAFVNNQTHASNTGGDFISEMENLREVQDVNGKTVYTSKSLDNFRHWIERRISDEKNIKFINTSKGANIQGMENKSFKEVLKSMI